MKKLFILIAVVLVIGLGVGAFFLFSPKQEASAVMTLDVNPNIQLVLDQNDKVMFVNALNEDGEKLSLSVNFVGKTADEAAKLFVEASTNAGKINVNTSGTTVNINISSEDADSEKYAALKESVKTKVNNYFKEIGVKAGALVDVNENIKNELVKLGVDVASLADATYSEIMKNFAATSENLNNVALSLRDGLNSQINTFKAQLKQAEETLNATLESLQAEIDALPNNALTNTLKQTLQQQINQAKQTYNTTKTTIEKAINDAIELVRTNSEEILQQAKTTFNNLINEGKTLVNSHKEAFEANKDAILAEIEAFQATL